MTTHSIPSRIAAIHYQRGFDIDSLFANLCSRLADDCLKLGGLLQISSGCVAGGVTSVNLVDLRTHKSFDIWEDRGTHASGCRLDEAGLLEAAQAIDAAIRDRVDLLVFNRFGRAESQGRGLVPYFADALEAEIAVLTSVREPYVEAWNQFHDGLAVEFETHLASVVAWATTSAQSSQEYFPQERLV